MESAADQVEDAYVSYVESRRRMRELALSRGFYPIVALGPEVQSERRARAMHEVEKAKAKQKMAKERARARATTTMARKLHSRPASGLRRFTPSSTPSTSSGASSELRSTLSGSTSQHGPRFKRYRVQGAGVKEVSEDQVTMVEDITEDKIYQINAAEECLFSNMVTGMAIVDSGASRTVEVCIL